MASLSSLYSLVYSNSVDPDLTPLALFDPVTADFNGDGKQDLLVLGFDWPGASQTNTAQPGQLYWGDGNGGFTPASEAVFPSSTLQTVHPRKVIVEDLNGDGTKDIFISNHGWDADPFPGEQNRLYLSNGDGGWDDATSELPQLDDYSHTSTVGDIDKDGDVDIFVGNGYAGKNHILSYFLINQGNDTFEMTRSNIPTSNGSILDFDHGDNGIHHFPGATLTDLDGDEYPDLIITADASASYDLNKKTTILWNKNGSFSESDKTELSVPAQAANQIALDAQAMDINGDGLQDLVIAGTQGDPFYDGWFVQIMLNEGDHKFVDVTSTCLEAADSFGGSTGIASNQPAACWVKPLDFNGDGFMDFSVEYIYRSRITAETPLVWLNDGTGHFQTLKAGDFVDSDEFWVVQNGGHCVLTDHGYSLLGAYMDGSGKFTVAALVANAPYTATLQSDGSAQLFGDSSDNTITGGTGNDTISGGGGTDTATYSGAEQNYTVVMTQTGYQVTDNVGTDGVDTLSSIERIQFQDNITTLSDGSEQLFGDSSDNTITGGTGNDTISGGVGTDTATYSGAEQNYSVLRTQSGYQVTDNVGTDGVDTLSSIERIQFQDKTTVLREKVTGTAKTDKISVGSGDYWISAGEGNNIVSAGSGHNVISCGAGADKITTGNGDNSIDAGAGNNVIITGSGSDTITGGAGRDIIKAGAGDDRIVSGAGKDQLRGGEGADTFVFSAAIDMANVDTIADFAEDDILEISIEFFGSLAATHSAENLAIDKKRAEIDGDDYLVYDSRTGKLYYDADGSGSGSSAIQIAGIKGGGAKTLSIDDFNFA